MPLNPYDYEMRAELKLVQSQIRAVEAGHMPLSAAHALPRGTELIDGKVVMPTPAPVVFLQAAGVLAIYLLAAMLLLFAGAASSFLRIQGWSLASLIGVGALCLAGGRLVHHLRDVRKFRAFAWVQVGIAVLGVIASLLTPGSLVTKAMAVLLGLLAIADGYERLNKVAKSQHEANPA